MTKTYELPKEGCLGSRRIVAEFDENGVGKITIQALDSLISELNEYAEQRQTGHWIPTSERLPEDRREVLVTAYWHETYQVMMASYYGEGLWWCVPFNNCGEHMQRLKPKAWMPLPEPHEIFKQIRKMCEEK